MVEYVGQELVLQTLARQAIWVVDPGLMEAGGHHAALAETLCQCQNDAQSVDIAIYAHEQLDLKLKHKLEESGFKVKASFVSVFYQHYQEGALHGPRVLQSYIRVLATEYAAILTEALTQAQNKPIVLFYPCLNWEHAWALSLVVIQYQTSLAQANVHLVCCAMYSPLNNVGSATRALWFKLGFQTLQQQAFVSLYCSEFETCEAYRAILGSDNIRIHPCYLMDWQSIQPSNLQDAPFKLPNKTYLLYMGDAKEDKGFNRLPSLLKQALANTSVDTTFIIQFTLAWDYPEIQHSLDALKALAKNEPRLILHQGFWSNTEVAYVMQHVQGAVCTYDTQAYKHKSSGMLWMLAYFNCPFIIAAPCWLSREAERLDANYKISNNLHFDDVILQSNLAPKQPITYAQNLFKPLLTWLLEH